MPLAPVLSKCLACCSWGTPGPAWEHWQLEVGKLALLPRAPAWGPGKDSESDSHWIGRRPVSLNRPSHWLGRGPVTLSESRSYLDQLVMVTSPYTRHSIILRPRAHISSSDWVSGRRRPKLSCLKRGPRVAGPQKNYQNICSSNLVQTCSPSAFRPSWR